ncbi:universal stress protein [Micromonospora sp. NPDC003197]
MTCPAAGPVVVGVDDSPVSRSAVRLAAQEAATRDLALRVVHVFDWGPDPTSPQAELRDSAEQMLAEAMAVAKAGEPDIEVTSAIIEGHPIVTLLREAAAAALIVVGDGNLATRNNISVDATAVQIAARAGCGALIARETAPPVGPILVGFDGSASSRSALDFAFDSAQRRGRELSVVRVVEAAKVVGDIEPGPVITDGVSDELAEALAPWQSRYPSVTVNQRVRAGDPDEILIEESRSAELVAVGARGEQPWRGALGAVSQALLYHSPSPVLIVRHPAEQ